MFQLDSLDSDIVGAMAQLYKVDNNKVRYLTNKKNKQR